MNMSLWHFFTDPVLRAPAIGSMLLCMVSGLVGVLVFLRKRSLLGESLAHATYPGVTGFILLAGFLNLQEVLSGLILIGAFLSALIGYWVIDCLEKKWKVSSDASLTAVLAFFFGAGITIASVAQHQFPNLYRQMQTYLYGQAATMTDIHIVIYGVLALCVILFIAIFYKELAALLFDTPFAAATGIAHRFLEMTVFCVVVLTLVIGVRCAGVILMSAMLIAPAVSARQFTNRLSLMFVWSALFGALGGFLGIYSSVVLSQSFAGHYSVPSGPMIVLVSGSIALYALLFAPKRGLVIRYIRIAKFRAACVQENLLKAIWRLNQEGCAIDIPLLIKKIGFPSFYLRLILNRLIKQKTLYREGVFYHLTRLGIKNGARIVRLHRLWEAYLVYSLGLKIERVHKSAEEMEHILTPELEEKLTLLLDDPKKDPHQQPIPEVVR